MNLRIAFQGIKGAYSEDACNKLFGDSETLPCHDFYELFSKVACGDATHGVVPVENSLHGSVTQVNDLLLENDLTVTKETVVQIKHCLIIQPDSDLSKIKRVYSHPQALGQCSKYLNEMPWEIMSAYDTAGSVKMIADDGSEEEAAIASRRAAEEYNMKIAAENIQNEPLNYTRFFVIEKNPEKQEGDRFSIAFAVKDAPGSLCRALKYFAENNVNLTRLESRPRKNHPWEYVFYADMDWSERASKATAELNKKAAFVKVLGRYSRIIKDI